MGLHGGVWAVAVPAGLLACYGHRQPGGKSTNSHYTLTYPSIVHPATHPPVIHLSIHLTFLPSIHSLSHLFTKLHPSVSHPCTYVSSIYPSIHSPILHLSTHPFIHPHTRVPLIHPSTHLPSVHLLLKYLFILYLSTHPIICPSTCSSVTHPPIHLSICPPLRHLHTQLPVLLSIHLLTQPSTYNPHLLIHLHTQPPIHHPSFTYSSTPFLHKHTQTIHPSTLPSVCPPIHPLPLFPLIHPSTHNRPPHLSHPLTHSPIHLLTYLSSCLLTQ